MRVLLSFIKDLAFPEGIKPQFFFLYADQLPLSRSFPQWKILLTPSEVKKKLPFDGCFIGCVKGIRNLSSAPSQQISNTAVVNWQSCWQPLQRGQRLMYVEADLFSDFISRSAEQASQCEEENAGSYCHC